ncbi:kinesin-II 95 kDa subunit [Verticillium alfalfae VaMs.102]|uniref:Kinesin-like protein n=1 Tax=Verticillium alfalfae (strain VaMs.102 / ATCC MYA-4576 / FGSC 10136) TaxID=526221 RepID=C9SIF4_VERA1|nr:kinesin-II 95 kDa subunit [Verticillium alfalfae VaMs.102]EEY18727.1 kinesin-II 95 kDa subunit [Verticillium alfalfae VaMs.102]
MATTLPRPSRPSNGPPTMALPALPIAKTRKSTGNIPTPASRSIPNTPNPKSGLRAPSTSFAPPTSPAPTSALPQPRSSSALGTPARTLRKTVSINSFPQPPRSEGRVSSLPPSPLGADSPRNSVRKSRASLAPSYSHLSNGTPSLLNNSGEGKSISSASVRMSDGLISISSPPQSRSSSAQDSYSTSATTYDDPVDGAASKGADASDKRLSKLEGKGNVLVSVRVRPDANGSDNNKSEGEWMVDGRKSLVAYRGKDGGDHFYDNVFSTHDDNGRVYDHIAKRLVRRVMEGYHGTVFAYGMTGTGKTFSMQGTASSPGVIPLAITDIFSYIRETPSREFLLRVSYLEIYNERIHDLLSMSTAGVGVNAGQEEIKLREDAKRGVYASPLKEEIVQSPTQLLRVIARGDQARRTASTQFNARSSRSHAVVQIVVESRERIPGNTGGESKRSGMLPGGVRVSTLSLIDLAGSEKAAESKERRTEGSHINKSLLTLGTVISKLSDSKDKEGKSADKDGKHLPYRDSKLTRLLQGALSGNSLVSILCTIQIALQAPQQRARVLLERYRVEIADLRLQLDAQAKAKKQQNAEEEKTRDVEEEKVRELEAEHRHEEQMLEMHLARTALKERIDHLNRLILSSKSTGVNSGTFSSLGVRSSMLSSRSSMATPSSGRPLIERTSSMTSATSTIGRRSSGGAKRFSGGETAPEDEDSTGEYGDGTASLTAQNRALQADLADKTRYIQTLEKRLMQARRASSSRTSIGFSAPNKGIMVGEDHSVSTLLKDKDTEIADLRARLDDKDRMLAALRSAARSRDTAEGTSDNRTSSIFDSIGPPPTSPPAAAAPLFPDGRNRRKSVDEMSKMLDEMIHERVENGQIVRGNRGSVRVVNERRLEPLPEPATGLEPLRQSPTLEDAPKVLVEA